MRPACDPDCTIFVPPGMVSQYESAMAVGSLMTFTGAGKVFPPSVEHSAHTVPGPKSWYDMHSIACFVVLPGGIHPSNHCRSTRKGLPEVFEPSSADVPWMGKVLPPLTDWNMSTYP